MKEGDDIKRFVIAWEEKDDRSNEKTQKIDILKRRKKMSKKRFSRTSVYFETLNTLKKENAMKRLTVYLGSILFSSCFLLASVASANINIAAGRSHTVGLKADGRVVAVGWNIDGQCDVNTWSDIMQVAAGNGHTVGLKSNGRVIAIGDNNDGQCNVSSFSDIVQVAAGGFHTVGLMSDGKVIAIGDNNNGQCNVSSFSDIMQVAAGSSHTVGLKSDGTVMAVGDNNDGQCDVSGWSDIMQVAAGSGHTVGVKTDGTVIAVGRNVDGIHTWSDIVQVAAGRSHTVGVKSDGTVVAVGYNGYGQCDVNTLNDVVQVAAGRYHTVGLKSNGRVVAVGDNGIGQCNVSNWILTLSMQVAAGSGHTVGVKTDGTVVAVGDNYHGECDVGSWSDIVQVAAGLSHTVGLKSDGRVVAVGRNDGRCDVGSWSDIVQVSACAHTVGLKADGTVVAVGVCSNGECDVGSWSDIVQVSAAYDHTVGLKSNGRVVAVGHNYDGQCDVGSWSDIVQVAARGFQTVGLKSNGRVVAVGRNSDGQCDVGSWSDIVQVAAGGSYTVGLKSNGTMVAVGDNSDGRCDVGSWSDIVQVASGGAYTVGLKSDGRVVAVGFNRDGQCDVGSWILGTQPYCHIAITPSSPTPINSGDSIHFSAVKTGTACVTPPVYDWLVSDQIGSIIDGIGNYQAGQNNTGSSVEDVIRVNDYANKIIDFVSVTIIADSTSDSDGDSIPDHKDNCPVTPNGLTGGTCTRGLIGNPCMNDGVCGRLNGLCSMNQEDGDNDGYGDACDNCPTVWNRDQNNSDNDSHGDVCDNCPNDDNEDQANSDRDSSGNVCDNCWYEDNNQADTDGNCPNMPYLSDPQCGDVCDSNPGDPCGGCDDSNPCTDDVCNMATGVCAYSALPDNTSCDLDGLLYCTEDVCISGICKAGGSPCNAGEVCDDNLGCYVPNSCTSNAECIDNNPCIDGVCDVATSLCVYSAKPDGETCDDGLSYTADDACVSGECVGTPPDCSYLSDECNEGVFDENLGQCVAEPVNEGMSCGNGLVCRRGICEQRGSCDISIDTAATNLKSGQPVQFTVNETGDCNNPDYEWSVVSTIQSTIDQNGNYAAGINRRVFKKVTDVVRVVDHANDDVADEITVTVSWKCFLVKIYGEDSEEIRLMRNFRDSALSQTVEGRELIKLYYEFSPVILMALESDDELTQEVKALVDGILPLIGSQAK